MLLKKQMCNVVHYIICFQNAVASKTQLCRFVSIMWFNQGYQPEIFDENEMDIDVLGYKWGRTRG